MSIGRFRRFVVAFSAAVVCGAGAARAAVIAVDSFDYDTSTNSSLNTRDGGTGWTGQWTALASGNGVDIVAVPSITTTLASGGAKAMSISNTGNAITGSRPFAAQTGDVWFSVLFRTPAAVGSDDFMQFSMNNDAVQNDSASIGDMNTSATGGELFSVRIGGSNGGTTVSGSVVIAGATDYLLVGRVSHDGATATTNYNRVEMWVNPTSRVAPNNLVTSSDANSNMASISVFTFRPANLAAGTDPYFFDEIRIGTTYADVIPEPSGVALLGVPAAMGLVRRRRRG